MIVVTTPTGMIGQQVLANVLDSGERVRVIARDPSRLPSHTRERVEVVQGSHGDIDVAAVAARLLLAPSWRGQEDVPVLGPEDLSFNDMAQIMSEVRGKPVRFQQIHGEAFKAGLTGFGMSEAFAEGMLDMMVAKNEGLDNAEPRTAQSTTPTSFPAVVRGSVETRGPQLSRHSHR